MKIFIFEDEFLIANALKAHLEDLGYQNIVLATTLEKPMQYLETEIPDFAILDIRTPNDSEAGIQVAKRLKAVTDVPFIFMTANNEKTIQEKAFDVNPFAYLEKSFTQSVVYYNIEQAVINFAKEKNAVFDKNEQEEDTSYFFNTEDYILIRKSRGYFQKVAIADIQYVFAEGGLIQITTENATFSYCSTLSSFLKQVDDNKFMKVSRNYVMNIHHFDAFTNQNYISVAGKKILLSQTEHKKLFNLFKVLRSK